MKCRFSGFSADAAFTLLVDGTEQAGALAEISGNVVTFRNVTLSTGSRRITVHGVETAGEKLLAATDTSIVTVPEPPSIQVSAEHSDETRSFVVTAGSANFGENAAYTLTAYAEGQSALEKTGLTAGELTKGISIDDRELPLSGECSSVFFVVTGTEGLAHASGISQLLSVGSGCGPNPPPTSAFVITSPANGQVIPRYLSGDQEGRIHQADSGFLL